MLCLSIHLPLFQPSSYLAVWLHIQLHSGYIPVLPVGQIVLGMFAELLDSLARLYTTAISWSREKVGGIPTHP